MDLLLASLDKTVVQRYEHSYQQRTWPAALSHKGFLEVQELTYGSTLGTTVLDET